MDTKREKANMIIALQKSLGRVTEAAESCGIARSTHYLWMTTDEEYKTEVDSIADMALDFVEGKLFDLIDGAERTVMSELGPVKVKDAPNPAAAIFYLKTKGKKRNYIERQEITGADSQPVKIEIAGNI